MNLPLFGGRKKRESTIIRDYEKTLDEAMSAMKRGDDDRAHALLRRINRWVTEDFDRVSKLSDDEKSKISRILTRAGEKMLILKDYEYAIKTLEKAKLLDEANVKAWLTIGRNLLERNTQIPYAVACLKEAVKLDSNNVEANMLLGDAFRMQGQIDEAIAMYNRALELDPQNENIISKLLKIQPDDVNVLVKYAELLKNKEEVEELLKIYNKLYYITKDEKYLEAGLDIDPGNKDLLVTKVRFLIEKNDLVEANRIVEQLRSDYPDDPSVQMLYEELSEGIEKEEFKPIAVDELFGDIGIDETLGEFVEELSEEQVKAEPIQAKPEKEVEEVKVVEPKEKVAEKKLNKVEEFMKAFKENNKDKAKEILEALNEDEFVELMGREMDFELAKFIVENVKIENGNMILDEMISNGKLEYAEKMFNEILKKDFKNSKALFYKGKLMAAKNNEMGARNFLLMSIKFDPKMKSYIKGDRTLQKYSEKEWFNKLVS